jgi:hypothetical protein
MAETLVFKGGNIPEQGLGFDRATFRDVDLALDRRYLGFDGPMGKNQVDKLRRAFYRFIREMF